MVTSSTRWSPLVAFACLAATAAHAGSDNPIDLVGIGNLLIARDTATLPMGEGTGFSAIEHGDFNCDGRVDIAVGDRFFDEGGLTDMGIVGVMYGDARLGIASGGDVVTQAMSGVAGTPETNDMFGASFAAADFTGDGCDDLAIGAQREAIGTTSEAGGVNLLEGDASGLVGGDGQFVPEDNEPVPAGPTLAHEKGAALAAVRVPGEAPQLAIGVIGHSPFPHNDAGAIAIRSEGLRPLSTPEAFVDFGTGGAPLQSGRRWGQVIVSGDFDRDNRGDIASLSSIFGPGNRGVVGVILTDANPANYAYEFLSQSTAGMPGAEEDGDSWGRALAVGDFDDDGNDDLAIGAPEEDIGTLENAGAVTIVFGRPGGFLDAAGNVVRAQSFDVDDFPFDAAAADEKFGAALAVGDFDHDGFDDLAASASHARVGDAVSAGRIHILYGGAAGIEPGRTRTLDLSSAGMVGTPANVDLFGELLTAGDFNDDGVDDLAVSVLRQATSQQPSISVIFGSGETTTLIQNVSPNPVTIGQPYTVSVLSRRLGIAANDFTRGTVRITQTGTPQRFCTVTLDTTGRGTCSITPTVAGNVTLTAAFAGVPGYRASTSAARQLQIVAPPEAIFMDSFE